MSRVRSILSRIAFIVPALAVSAGAWAQQVTGTLGSPSATTTINGRQLPPPPPTWGGTIKEDALK